MITSMKTIIKCNDYAIKKAKNHTRSARVGVPKKFAEQEVILIPIVGDLITRKQENEEEYTIILESDTVLRKTVSLKNNTGITFVPAEYIGYDILIVPV